MAVGFGPKCSKVLLIIFNFIFWLSGAGILGVGIYLIVDSSILQKLEIIQASADDPYLKTAAYVLIGVGAFIFVVGFFGCCGAIKESKCMLGLYIFFLVIVMAGELAAGVLVAVYKGEIVKAMKDGLVDKIKKEYGTGTTFDIAWDGTQFELECCGVTDVKDWKDSNYYENETKKAAYVPLSCCVPKDRKSIKSDRVGKLNTTDVKDAAKCRKSASDFITSNSQLDSAFIYSEGCYKGLENWFMKYSVILIGVGCGIAGLEIFGLVFAICLCRNIGEEVD